MISEIKIQNFKSIQDLKLKLGRVTVLVGENGSGKSNILEAIAFAGCASVDKLDNEYLAPRGIRVTEDTWMVSAFPKNEEDRKQNRGIQFELTFGNGDGVFNYSVFPASRIEDGSFLKWVVFFKGVEAGEIEDALSNRDFAEQIESKVAEMARGLKDRVSKGPEFAGPKTPDVELIANVLRPVMSDFEFQVVRKERCGKVAEKQGLSAFVIYSPENSVLRSPPPEGAIQPLGTKGEGFFKLLQSFTGEKLDEKFKDRLADMQSRLHVFGWFDKFLPPDDSATNQARLEIHDRWLAPDKAVFDQRSANEGFLFVLFYFTVLMSWRTPIFFAIDNIDTALNPKLCSILMAQIVELAKKYDKQVICTTHNPAILDGLNINDDEQRLFTVQRDEEGHTVVNRVQTPKPQPGKPPMKLSAAFLAGHIGGLPDHF